MRVHIVYVCLCAAVACAGVCMRMRTREGNYEGGSSREVGTEVTWK